MYLIAIAWLYVALLYAVADDTIVGGVLTFLFFGLGPLSLFLWLFGTPARRRAARVKEITDSALAPDAQTPKDAKEGNDSAERPGDQ